MYSNLATLQQRISITTKTLARFARQILIVRPGRNQLSNMQLHIDILMVFDEHERICKYANVQICN